jgi:lysophospholipase L1-like esterase
VRATDTANQTVDSNAFNVVIASGPTQVPHNDAAIVFSPYAWDDRGAAKSANAPGAYARLTFSGTSVTAKFDVSALVAAGVAAGSYPIVRMVIDGRSVTDVQLSSGSPNAAVSALAAGTHTVEMYFRAVDVNLSDRWGASAGAQPVSALVFTGFTLDAGATYSAPAARAKRMIFFGDSITEGYMTINGGGSASGNSALWTVPPFVAQALGCEYGQIGYSAQGWERVGNGGVPVLNSSIGFYSNGRSRLVNGKLSPEPDYVFTMHGANGVPTTAGVGTVIDSLRTMAPNARIFVMIPAGGYARAAITAAASARGSDPKLTLIDLGTEYQPGMDSSGNNGQYSNDNGLHPNLLGNAKAATGYLPKIQAALDGAALPTTNARTVSLTIATGKDANNQPILAANLTGIKLAVYDEPTPDLRGAARF